MEAEYNVWRRAEAEATMAYGQRMDEKPPFVMERYGRLKDMDRSFDIAYWQKLGPEAIFEAAWQMVVDVYSRRPGGSDELRLRRTVENFQRQWR
jgi:hypothetical protein